MGLETGTPTASLWQGLMAPGWETPQGGLIRDRHKRALSQGPDSDICLHDHYTTGPNVS